MTFMFLYVSLLIDANTMSGLKDSFRERMFKMNNMDFARATQFVLNFGPGHRNPEKLT